MTRAQSIRRQWIKELRSGNYKQGNRRLRDENRHCCLGVLCDIVKKRADVSLITKSVAEQALSEDGVLPGEVCELLGTDSNPVLHAISTRDHKHVHESLTSLNDDGLTFPQIADMIEREVQFSR